MPDCGELCANCEKCNVTKLGSRLRLCLAGKSRFTSPRRAEYSGGTENSGISTIHPSLKAHVQPIRSARYIGAAARHKGPPPNGEIPGFWERGSLPVPFGSKCLFVLDGGYHENATAKNRRWSRMAHLRDEGKFEITRHGGEYRILLGFQRHPIHGAKTRAVGGGTAGGAKKE